MPETAPSTRTRIDWLKLLETYGVVLVLVALVAFFSVLNERFLSLRNLTNIVTEVSIYGIIAVGMTFVILTRGVDLAVGSLVGLSGIMAALAVQSLGIAGGLAGLVGLVVGIGVGLMVGLGQGLIVVGLGVPPFIVTLGGLTAWRGATLMANDGAPVAATAPSYLWWGGGQLYGLPVPVLVFAAVAGVGFFVLRRTRYGRHIYAVGGNPEAAHLAGLNVRALIASVYVTVGALSGLAGFLLSARL